MTKPCGESKHVMILTGEPSGDIHGAALIAELTGKLPGITVSGIGGPALEKEGARLFFDIRDLTVMGLTEVICRLNHIKTAYDRFRQQLYKHPPDLLVLVDFPGFNLKAAALAKKHGIPVLYYIAPKVWAWKKSRLKTIKKVTDHVALIFPFEPKIYQKAGIPATFVGNPLLGKDHRFIAHMTPESSKPKVIGLLPGSRKNEIRSLLPVMIMAADMIAGLNEDIRFIVSAASHADLPYIKQQVSLSRNSRNFTVTTDPVATIFKSTDLLVAASGTVTLEAAVHQVPTVIVYKVSPVTFFFGKRLVQLDYIGLPNIIAGRQVMPELLQEDVSPEKIFTTVSAMLEQQTLDRIRKELGKIRHLLGSPGAAGRTAGIAVRMMK